jgi:hypothetical protein
MKYKKLLKGHGNEADFLGFLHKSVPHEYLTLPFEPFQFCLRIRGDIRNQKTTHRLAEPSRRIGDSQTRRVGESFFDFEYLREFEAKIRTARNVV